MSGANPASYLSLLVNSQPDWRYFMPLDAHNLENSNALEQTTDIAGMLSLLWPLSKFMCLII